MVIERKTGRVWCELHAPAEALHLAKTVGPATAQAPPQYVLLDPQDAVLIAATSWDLEPVPVVPIALKCSACDDGTTAEQPDGLLIFSNATEAARHADR